jgi:hypothetical protein
MTLSMTHKSKPTQLATTKQNDPAEYRRFFEAAKKTEASDDPKDFDGAFKKVASDIAVKRD